jgi:hypothetical protein
MLQYFSTLHSFYPRSYSFYWLDSEDGNGKPDIGDTFSIYGAPDFRPMDPEFAKQRLDPDNKSPINHEITAGIQHELFKNFSVGANFIYKKKDNILDDALYSPDEGKYWYHLDQPLAAANWIPYSVTIPGRDKYPDRDVTFYVRKNDSPPIFYRLNNIPTLYRKYVAGELIFNKRMSNGWQLNGSIVYSKASGNIGGWYDQSWGWTGAADSPNSYVNTEGRINIDRPLQIKLMGTAVLPYRILLSVYYHYQSGSPWARYAGIRPAADWCTANNTYRTYYSVNIEPEGSRRLRDWNQLDLRVEKEFNISTWGRLGIYADVLNLLGHSGVNVGVDDLYRWDSAGEGTSLGTEYLESSYKVISSAYGIRTIRFTLRFSFF